MSPKKSSRKTGLPASKAKNAYDLLGEVRALILAEPKRYDQSTYIERGSGVTDDREFPACGTVGCVAGWVATLKRKTQFDGPSTPKIAAKILGLTDDQRWDLFDGDAAGYDWQTEGHAQLGAAHIKRFQQAHAAQLKARRV